MKATTAKHFAAVVIIAVCCQAVHANEPVSQPADAKSNSNATLTTNANKTWNSYASSLQAARQSGKPVMLVFSGSDWCGWCIRLQNEVFNTNEFNQWAQSYIHAVEVDFPRNHALPEAVAAQNQRLKEKFAAHVQFYPTVLFIDANEQVVGKSGFVQGGATNWITEVRSFAPAVDNIEPVQQEPQLEQQLVKLETLSEFSAQQTSISHSNEKSFDESLSIIKLHKLSKSTETLFAK